MLTFNKILLLTLTLLLNYGCSKVYKPDPILPKKVNITTLSNHFIFIDKNGMMRDENNKKVINFQTKIDNIYKKFNKLKACNKNLSISIYIHGGLNSFNGTVERVKNTYKRLLNKEQYPIFISWESGGLTNYKDHLFLLRNGEEVPLKAIVSSPFVIMEDSLRAISRVPASSYNILTGQNSLVVKYLTNQERDANTSETFIDKHTGITIHKNRKRHASSGHTFIDFASIINPIKFISAPVIDALGKGAWRSMLRRTDLILDSNKANEGQALESVKTAASYFLEKLVNEHNSTKKILIGHSMGTIVANNILFKYPSINFEKIVYMAPACKLKDLRKAIVPWLLKDKNRVFYNLSLNPYRDINENTYYDFTPRGSLLIWIDEFLEDVNSFEDRTAGYWFNIIRSAQAIFPKDVHKQVHLTKFGIRDETPQRHGEFDDYNFWTKEFWENDEGLEFLLLE